MKEMLEKMIPIGQVFGMEDDLMVKILAHGKHGAHFKTEVLSNKGWEHCFPVGNVMNWHFNKQFGDDMFIFEAQSPKLFKHSSRGAQSLCCLYTDLNIVAFERDS